MLIHVSGINLFSYDAAFFFPQFAPYLHNGNRELQWLVSGLGLWVKASRGIGF